MKISNAILMIAGSAFIVASVALPLPAMAGFAAGFLGGAMFMMGAMS